MSWPWSLLKCIWEATLTGNLSGGSMQIPRTLGWCRVAGVAGSLCWHKEVPVCSVKTKISTSHIVPWLASFTYIKVMIPSHILHLRLVHNKIIQDSDHPTSREHCHHHQCQGTSRKPPQNLGSSGHRTPPKVSIHRPYDRGLEISWVKWQVGSQIWVCHFAPLGCLFCGNHRADFFRIGRESFKPHLQFDENVFKYICSHPHPPPHKK